MTGQAALPLEFSAHTLVTLLEQQQREIAALKTRLAALEDLDIEERLSELEDAEYDDDDDDPSICVDCGRDIMPAGGDHQWYMVHDEVWADAGMKPCGGYLCIPCLEKRLHRPLTGADFPWMGINRPTHLDTPYLAELKRNAALTWS